MEISGFICISGFRMFPQVRVFSVALVSQVEIYLVTLSYMNPVDVPAAFEV